MGADQNIAKQAWRMIDFPRVPDARGNLTFVEGGRHVPFDIKRVFYLTDVPGGASRGAHAHKKLQQVIIALSGSFEFTVDDGHGRVTLTLNRSHCGLYLPPMVWGDLGHFSGGSVCMVLASDVFDEADYFRNYSDFLAAVGVAA
jgi:hypothetical protein